MDVITSKRRLGLALVGIGLVVAGAALWILISQAGAGDPTVGTDFTAVPAKVDVPVPSLTLEDLAGQRHALSDYGGQVVLINLWATWCPPCAAEMPIFQRYFEDHGAEGFLVLAINDGESRRAVEAFVDEHGLTFPVWLDPTYIATDRAFKTRNLPTSYVVARDGRVRLMWIGAISQQNLELYVSPLIKE